MPIYGTFGILFTNDDAKLRVKWQRCVSWVLFIYLFIVNIFYKFTFVEFLVRQKIACHERIHLKFTKRTQL